MATYLERITKIVAEQLGLEESAVTPDSALADDLGADSLDFVELVLAIEAEFGIEVPDEDADKIKTVVDIVKYVEDKHKQKQ